VWNVHGNNAVITLGISLPSTERQKQTNGNNQHVCSFYNEIDPIIGILPVSAPPVVMESSKAVVNNLPSL